MSLRYCRWIFAILLGWLTLLNVAQAAISVFPLSVEFSSQGSRRQHISVVNNGDKTAYIQVIPYRVEGLGTKDEKRIEVKDLRELGLLVSPQKIKMDPKSRRNIRVVLLQPQGDKERVYSLVVKPVTGKLIAKRTGVRVVVAYGVRILVRPKDLQLNVNAKRQGMKVIVENIGNTKARIAKVMQCDAAGQDCQALEKPIRKDLYPNASFEFSVDKAQPVTFTISAEKQEKKITTN